MSPRTSRAVPLRRAAQALRRRLGRPRPRPAGRPAATYARVLDGDHLWLAVAGVEPTAALALRLDDGTTLPLAPEVAEPLPGGGASFRCPLPDAVLPAGARPGEASGATLVVVGPAGAAHPVVDATAPDDGPTRTPPSRRRDRQHAVGRDAGGAVVLTTTRLAPRAEVRGFGGPVPDPEALVADLALPPGCPAVTGAALAPLDGGPPAAVTWEPDGSAAGRVRVGPAGVVPAAGARLVLRLEPRAGGTPSEDLAVHRAHDGLRDPSAGVALPHPLLEGAAGDSGAAVCWAFGPDGALVVRRAEVGR